MKPTVLLVEDDDDTRVMLHNALEHGGFVVLSAGHSSTALRMLASLQPDALIVAVTPWMDGGALVGIIERDARLSRMPIVILAAHTDWVSRLSARAFLKKPVDIDVLTKTLSSCLTQ